jgi:hypothetical protein
MVYTQFVFAAAFRSCRLSSREDFSPHSRTFSIAHRVRRKHQQLPSSRVIESAVRIAAQFRFVASALPMNAKDLNEAAGAADAARGPTESGDLDL